MYERINTRKPKGEEAAAEICVLFTFKSHNNGSATTNTTCCCFALVASLVQSQTQCAYAYQEMHNSIRFVTNIYTHSALHSLHQTTHCPHLFRDEYEIECMKGWIRYNLHVVRLRFCTTQQKHSLARRLLVCHSNDDGRFCAVWGPLNGRSPLRFVVRTNNHPA